LTKEGGFDEMHRQKQGPKGHCMLEVNKAKQKEFGVKRLNTENTWEGSI
jgi:hypothetical protein